MMRFVYVLLIYLLAPVVMAMEGWRALWNPDYRGQLRQRLGLVAPEERPGCIWVHAVSVGEVQAASGLIRALHRRFPEHHVVVTTVTPTGAQRVRALFGDEVRHCYLPYDLPGSVARFLDRIQPRVAIIIETEIWPTLYRALGQVAASRSCWRAHASRSVRSVATVSSRRCSRRRSRTAS